jgi:hypothetical protein
MSRAIGDSGPGAFGVVVVGELVTAANGRVVVVFLADVACLVELSCGAIELAWAAAEWPVAGRIREAP